MKLVFYPAFDDAEVFTDHFYRLHWFLYPFRDQIDEVVLPVRRPMAPGALSPILDSSLASLVGKISVRIVEAAADEVIAQELSKADCVLAWKMGDDSKPPPHPALKDKRVIRIDHEKLRGATSFYLMFADAMKDLQASYIATSKRIFAAIKERCTSQVGYVFGTGPNLALAKDHDFSDGVSIACNSMVRNYELLERLKPPLIVAADPIFHAGPSSYAAEFRKDLIRAMDMYGSYLIVPQRDYHIYLAHMPAHLVERIAALPMAPGDKPNLDLSATYQVTTTANVLTLFLLPMAATFFKEVRILGCDGRPMSENSYFWSHDKASQINDKMTDIQKAHPAFFAIDFDDYYLTHCKILAAWLDAMEGVGRVVTNYTPSYIPALAMRTPRELRGRATSAMAGALLVSVDPEVGKNIGHYTPMNDRTAEAAEAAGLEFRAYGNIDLSQLPEGRAYLTPAFQVNSWAFRMRDTGAKAEAYDKFRKDLIKVREDLRKQPLSRHIRLFMYCGSMSAAEAMHDVFAREPNVSLSVNLFYCSFFDFGAPEILSRWKPVLQRFLSNGRNQLFATTTLLASEMSTAYGLPILALPHPSTSFDDKVDTSRWAALNVTADRPIRVIFPGAMREDKGFATSIAVVAHLMRDVPRYHFHVAARVRPETPANLVEALDKVRGGHLSVEDRNLDDAAFIDFLAKGDIAVLPYSAEAFRNRPSGLLVDLITLGRPLVALEGTWLADQIAGRGWGEIAADKPDAIAAAVAKIAGNYEAYTTAIAAGRGAYLATNSWSGLIDCLFDETTQPVGGRAQASPIEELGDIAERLRTLATALRTPSERKQQVAGS